MIVPRQRALFHSVLAVPCEYLPSVRCQLGCCPRHKRGKWRPIYGRDTSITVLVRLVDIRGKSRCTGQQIRELVGPLQKNSFDCSAQGSAFVVCALRCTLQDLLFWIASVGILLFSCFAGTVGIANAYIADATTGEAWFHASSE